MHAAMQETVHATDPAARGLVYFFSFPQHNRHSVPFFLYAALTGQHRMRFDGSTASLSPR
jgi:hypothetical protein